MRIGLVLPALPAYSETFFRNKILGLQNNGVELLLLVNSDQGHSIRKYMNCEVIVAPKLHGNIFSVVLKVVGAFFKIILVNRKASIRLYQLGKNAHIPFGTNIKQIISNQFLLNQKLDWLHFGFGTMVLGKENIAQTIGARMSVSFRGFDITHYPLQHPNCYTLLWDRLDKLHVISNSIAELVYKHGFNNQCPLVKITPAIDISLFSPNTKPKLFNKLQILTISRLHKVKGLNYILEALAMLKKTRVPFNYTIIGSGSEENALKQSAIELDLLDCITFIGELSPIKVKDFLEKTDLYLQYSIEEGFCNAVLEAQAMGVLCIVSDAGGLIENVRDGYSGWVVTKCSPKDLFRKINEIINLDYDQKEKVKIQAVKRVQEEFNLEKQIHDFLSFYEIN